MDYKKEFFITKFNTIPYKDYFIQYSVFRFSKNFKNKLFYLYSGKLWFKVRSNSWRAGLTGKMFLWPSLIAIYKKKQVLKKKKYGK